MAQIGYVCLGASDFDRACAFYDALAPELGGRSSFRRRRVRCIAWGPARC
jgi:catechol 2,3-dioxygenase-like lactoylglutathione lyase family enzyme